MVANPDIKESTAYQYNNQIQVGILYSNYNIGVCKFIGGVYTGTNCIMDTVNSKVSCITSITDNLKLKTFALVDASGFTYACIDVYTCSSGENCSGPSCTTYNSSPYASQTYIGIAAYSSTVLPSPSTLTLSPGNGTIAASWSSVSSGDLWVYYVEVLDGATPVKSGYTTSTEMSVNLTGLTNGRLYTVKVSAISRSNVQGTAISRQTTPAVQCTLPSCGFTLS